MPDPRISVVIPTYQRAHDCHAAVMSALEQELPPLEVLVCDDGSTDETEALFTRLAQEDPRVRYLRLAENRGTPAPARNLGIANALGHWIAFLDSDDRWLPAKLAKQSKFLAEDGYDVVASDATRISGGPYFDLHEREEPGMKEFLKHNPIIVSAQLPAEQSSLQPGAFRHRCWDTASGALRTDGLWMRLAHGGSRFLVLPDRLVVYGDSAADRMSNSIYRQEAATAAVRWQTWLKRPRERRDPAISCPRDR